MPNNNVYSVSQINKYIKNMFQNDYLLANLEIRGEVSNLKYHSSGHIYFTLKDEGGAIKGIMFSSYARTLKFRLEEGMQVVVSGSISAYERDGSYQIYAKAIKQEGVGSLYEEYEKLKKRLEESGMFDAQYKRPIPKYAKKLGVVTAPTGAAVRDIIDVSKRRNPGIEIILYPAIVQGPEAPASIVAGIEALDAYGVDVIICGRGGGSIEDLWGFNDEAVANAIFSSRVPVISAVGHETDFTIADFVSDLRAPTPSAAAELAVCDVRTLLLQISSLKDILNKDMRNIMNDLKSDVLRMNERINALSPKSKLENNKKALETYKDVLSRDMEKVLTKNKHRLSIDAGRLDINKVLEKTKHRLLLDKSRLDIDRILVKNKHRLSLNAGKLNALSPLLKLSSGYSFVADTDGKAVKSIESVNAGDILKINVVDGAIKASVVSTEGKL